MHVPRLQCHSLSNGRFKVLQSGSDLNASASKFSHFTDAKFVFSRHLNTTRCQLLWNNMKKLKLHWELVCVFSDGKSMFVAHWQHLKFCSRSGTWSSKRLQKFRLRCCVFFSLFPFFFFMLFLSLLCFVGRLLGCRIVWLFDWLMGCFDDQFVGYCCFHR